MRQHCFNTAIGCQAQSVIEIIIDDIEVFNHDSLNELLWNCSENFAIEKLMCRNIGSLLLLIFIAVFGIANLQQGSHYDILTLQAAPSATNTVVISDANLVDEHSNNLATASHAGSTHCFTYCGLPADEQFLSGSISILTHRHYNSVAHQVDASEQHFRPPIARFPVG